MPGGHGRGIRKERACEAGVAIFGSEIEWKRPAIVSLVAARILAPHAMGFKQAAVLSSVSFFLGEPSPVSHWLLCSL